MKSIDQSIMDVVVALRTYKGDDPSDSRSDEELVTNFLTGVQHYCEARRIDYVAIETLATTDYLSEV